MMHAMRLSRANIARLSNATSMAVRAFGVPAPDLSTDSAKEVAGLIARAREAQKKIENYTQEQVRVHVREVCHAGGAGHASSTDTRWSASPDPRLAPIVPCRFFVAVRWTT
jgi:hypothetical protein